jgi:plasmid stabilization system protein ParE
MSLPVRLRAVAQAEFDAAADDYEARSPGLGERFTRAVDEAFERIGRFPDLYAALFRDVRAALVRRFPFVVLFRVLDDHVLVIAVLPAKGNPAAWEERE